jgi:hypothetical protein
MREKCRFRQVQLIFSSFFPASHWLPFYSCNSFWFHECREAEEGKFSGEGHSNFAHREIFSGNPSEFPVSYSHL